MAAAFSSGARAGHRGARGGFDLLGTIGLGSALICLLLAVSKGAD